MSPVGGASLSRYGKGDRVVHLRYPAADAAYFHTLTSELGALITGRRTFDAAEGWGGHHP